MRSSQTVSLTKNEQDRLRVLPEDDAFFTDIERSLKIELPLRLRKETGDSLIRCVEFIQADAEADERTARKTRAIEGLARPLRTLLNELHNQSNFDAYDARREGRDVFDKYVSENSLFLVEGASRETQHLFQTNAQARQENLPAIGFNVADLEGLLKALGDHEIDPYRISKSDLRAYLLADLARIFIESGGRLGGSYKPREQKIDGPFIRFVSRIVAHCPDPLRKYLKPGISDAVRDWLRFIKWSQMRNFEFKYIADKDDQTALSEDFAHRHGLVPVPLRLACGTPNPQALHVEAMMERMEEKDDPKYRLRGCLLVTKNSGAFGQPNNILVARRLSGGSAILGRSGAVDRLSKSLRACKYGKYRRPWRQAPTVGKRPKGHS